MLRFIGYFVVSLLAIALTAKQPAALSVYGACQLGQELLFQNNHFTFRFSTSANRFDGSDTHMFTQCITLEHDDYAYFEWAELSGYASDDKPIIYQRIAPSGTPKLSEKQLFFSKAKGLNVNEIDAAVFQPTPSEVDLAQSESALLLANGVTAFFSTSIVHEDGKRSPLYIQVQNRVLGVSRPSTVILVFDEGNSDTERLLGQELKFWLTELSSESEKIVPFEPRSLPDVFSFPVLSGLERAMYPTVFVSEASASKDYFLENEDVLITLNDNVVGRFQISAVGLNAVISLPFQ